MTDGQQTLNGLLEMQALLESEGANIEMEFQRIAQKKSEHEQKLSALAIVIEMFGANNETENQDGQTAEQTVAESQSADSATESIPEPNNGNSEKGESDLHFELKPKENGHKPIRKQKARRGLKQTARDFFNELPNEYTKIDLMKILTREHPELKGKVNENTMTGIMKQFIRSGDARIKNRSKGKVLQVYEKVVA